MECWHKLEGCRELVPSDPRIFEELELSDFDNNLSKSYEVFRLRMVFRGANFGFGINYNKSESYMMFGPQDASVGVYKSFETLVNRTEPCSIRESKIKFDVSTSTPMEGVLTKGEPYDTSIIA